MSSRRQRSIQLGGRYRQGFTVLSYGSHVPVKQPEMRYIILYQPRTENMMNMIKTMRSSTTQSKNCMVYNTYRTQIWSNSRKCRYCNISQLCLDMPCKSYMDTKCNYLIDTIKFTCSRIDFDRWYGYWHCNNEAIQFSSIVKLEHQSISQLRTRVDIYMLINLWDVITNPHPNFTGSLANTHLI